MQDHRASLAAGYANVFDLRTFFTARIDAADPNRVGEAIVAAAKAVRAAGGGAIYLPPGEWSVQTNFTKPVTAVLLDTPGMSLCGAGVRASRLRLLGKEDCDVITIRAPGVTVERLTVIGNLTDPPPQSKPHGIASRGDPTFVSIRDVAVESVAGYGVYVLGRRETPGVYTNVSLRNVSISRCGNDGVDFKTRSPALEPRQGYPKPLILAQGPRAFLKNIAVHDHSQLYPDDAPGNRRGESGIDVRGQIHLENIEVLRVPPGRYGKGGGSGVVFRDAPPGPVGTSEDHGADARGSTMQNYYITRRRPLPGERRRAGGVVGPPQIQELIAYGNGWVVDE